MLNASHTNQNAVVAIFQLHSQAEQAVKELQKSGFNMKQLSIIGREYHTEENVVGYYNTGDRMKCWGKTGAFWGGIWGMLVGSAFFWIPGVGEVLIAGPLVMAIVGAMEGAIVIGGLNVLGAALYGIGIPKNSILKYETAIGAGKFAVIAHGAYDDVARARSILGSHEVESLDYHEAKASSYL